MIAKDLRKLNIDPPKVPPVKVLPPTSVPPISLKPDEDAFAPVIMGDNSSAAGGSGSTPGTVTVPETKEEPSTENVEVPETPDAPEENSHEEWYGRAQGYLDEYLGREGFSYDVNADELYRTFRQQAMAKAEASRRDATARAAGLTGGYGSTYAGAVGNAAYDSAMESVDEIIPELYNAAYSRYQQEGQDLLTKASVAGQIGDRLYNESQTKAQNSAQAVVDQQIAEEELLASIIDPEGSNKKIIAALQNYSTPQGQAKYLASQILAEGETKETHPWKLTEAEAAELMAEYGLPMLEESTWEAIDDGGTNWWGGIDTDATVRNENGEEFTLGDLEDALAKTMGKDAAKAYVEKLWNELFVNIQPKESASNAQSGETFVTAFNNGNNPIVSSYRKK